jgi:hypothetical protein
MQIMPADMVVFFWMQVLAGLVAIGALVVFSMVCTGVLLRCDLQYMYL